jgi:hypothetical protein
MNPSQLQNHFDAFYEDFFCEMCKYGEVEEVVVCDNNNDRKLLVCSCFASGANDEQISSATSTPGSNTKKPRRLHAMRLMRGGTRLDRYIASSVLLPISEKPVVD